MKKTIYRCIDDMPDQVRAATERLSSAIPGLTLELRPPEIFSKQVSELVRLRKNKKLDGVILDLRLDDEGFADYKAQNLATQLRSLMAEGKVRDFPIVLWSISQKFARSYTRDLTSHDLFDLRFDKDELHNAGSVAERAAQLVSLAKGFELVAKQSRGTDFWKLLLKTPHNVVLDPRIGQNLDTSLKKSPTHLIARFVLKMIVERPGPLIDQSTLCARLGIEEASLGKKLLEKLRQRAAYKGPFSDAWPRWWWPAVEKWWRKLDVGSPSILSLTAAERVEQLRKSGYKGLKPAQPIVAGYSTRFTTICHHLRQPLDSIDGFMLTAVGLESWQDRLYVSREVVLRPGHYRFKEQLDSLEMERAKEARKAAAKKPHAG